MLALLLAGGAFGLVGQAAQFDKLHEVVVRAHKVWIPVCLTGQLLAYLGYILAYHDAARSDGGPQFDYPTTTRIVAFGIGMSILGASVGGLAVDFWALRRTGTHVHTAARRVLAVGTIEWTVLSVYAVGAAAAVVIMGAHPPPAMALAWLLVVPACFSGALFFTSPKRVRRLIELRPDTKRSRAAGRLRRVLQWLHEKAHDSLADAIAGVVLVRHLLSHPIRYKGGAIGYPIYWAGDMLTLYAALRCFGVSVSIDALILAYATSFLISALPLPAGGAGGVDAGMTFALTAIGVGLAPAILAVLVYRVITFWLPLIPALLLVPSMRRLHDELPSVPHTPRDRDEGVSFRPPADAAA